MSIESDQTLLCFCFTSFCDWSRKLAPLSEPIRCEIKKKHELIAGVSRALGNLLVLLVVLIEGGFFPT